MPQSLQVFLIEWDQERSSRLGRLLTANGWQVMFFPDVESFRQTRPPNVFGLALIDCEKFKETEKFSESWKNIVPYIVIGRSGTCLPDHSLKWLDLGAEDYIMDNSGDQVFLAKLRAHMRRLLPVIAREMEMVKSPCKDLMVDSQMRRVLYKHPARSWQELARLSDTETKILSFLLQSAGETLSRREILFKVWGRRGEDLNPEIVVKYVSMLKRKLRHHGKKIRSVYGVGYYFSGVPHPQHGPRK